MKLQPTSAKVIKSLADSDCKYAHLEDCLIHEHVKRALNGPVEEATVPHPQLCTGGVGGGKKADWEARYCPS